MYTALSAGELTGIITDYDFQDTSWNNHGAVPFTALEMVEHGLEKIIPRLHRQRFEAIHLGPLARITLVSVRSTTKITLSRSLSHWPQISMVRGGWRRSPFAKTSPPPRLRLPIAGHRTSRSSEVWWAVGQCFIMTRLRRGTLGQQNWKKITPRVPWNA